jgi:DNA-binding NtrC family response regulator
MTITGHVALFGEFSDERMKLNAAARGFGWSVRNAGESRVEPVDAQTPLLAVLIRPESLGMPWTDALELIRSAAPGIPVVICHGSEELDAQTEMAASGAFYTLLLPADSRELPFMFSQLDASLAAAPKQTRAQEHPRLSAPAARAA